MKITVHRHASQGACTIGTLAIDGVPFCFTLEDVVREQPGEPVTSWKVFGQTAIPRGEYVVAIDDSAHFCRPMPHILDVPGFQGVRIHAGNTAADTEGCILLGFGAGAESISKSRDAFADFYARLHAALTAGESATIEVS